MFHISKVLSLIVVTGGVLVGCMSMPAPPTVGLQRSLYPGLGDLKPEQIADAFSTTVVLTPPISAGLAWLSEAPPQGQYEASAISEYHRTGVLEAALEARPKSLHRGSTIAICLGRPGMGGGHARSSRVSR